MEVGQHAAAPLVRAMIEQGFDDATITSTVQLLGLPISRRTVGRMRHGRPSDSLLSPGERRMATPIACPGTCRGMITILPCRVCGGDLEAEPPQPLAG
jgi:hypothetical protein